MTLRRSIYLAVFTFVLMVAWGLYGGLHYGWAAIAPFSWNFINIWLVMLNAVAWGHLFYRVWKKEKQDNDD